MERSLPAPTMRLFRGETCIFMPTFVEELVRAIRQIAPRQRRDGINHLPKFRFRLLDFVERISEGLLRPLTIGYVHYGPYVLNDFARSIEDYMTYAMNVSDLFVRMNDSVVHFKVHLVAHGFRHYIPATGLIVRMNPLPDSFSWRRACLRFKT